MVDKALTVQDDHRLVDNPAGYGDRNDIFTLADRIGKVMSITCKDGKTRRPPTPKESALIANYSMSVGANCFRNEVHVWEDENGQLVMCDDYKLLIRWANTQMPFTDDYRILPDEEKDYENINRDDLAVECFVLRRDHQDLFREMMFAFIKDGMKAIEAKWEAYKIAASRSIGVVSYNEMYGKDNRGVAYLKTKKIPKGWGTFVKRARTRALRGAIRISHRTPSPQEIYQTGLQIGQTQTQPDDWQGVEIYKTEPERLQAAKVNAWHREATESPSLTPDQVKAATDAMRNNGDDDPLDLSPEEGDFIDLPEGDPDFPGSDPSDTWLPDVEEFQRVCSAEFKRPWSELADILKNKLNRPRFKTDKAVELYQLLQGYFDDIDHDKPHIPHQDGLFEDEDAEPINGAYAE